MPWLDILILIILVASIAYSLLRGLVREIISFGAVILAAILATRYCQWGSKHLTGLVKNERLAAIIGFALIFLGIIAAGVLVGRLIKNLLKKTGLGPMDKFLGGLLGFLKAGVIIATLLMLTKNFIPKGKKIIDNSRIAPIFLPVANVLSDFLPKTLLDKIIQDIEEKAKKLGKKLKHYDSESKNFIPSKVKDIVEDSKEALEEDRKKVENILKENLDK